MKPFLRPADRARLTPVGWTSEPAGLWAGREVEVVYDPRQHQIVMVRNNPGDLTRARLAAQGFRRLAVDDRQEMWVRNRNAEHQRGLAPVTAIRPTPTASRTAGIEGRGL